MERLPCCRFPELGPTAKGHNSEACFDTTTSHFWSARSSSTTLSERETFFLSSKDMSNCLKRGHQHLFITKISFSHPSQKNPSQNQVYLKFTDFKKMLQKINKALNSRKDIIISNSKEIWEPAPFYTCLILKILIIFKVLFLS